MMHEPNKTCWGCGMEKPLSDFWRRTANPDHKDHFCIACKQAKRIKYESTAQGLYESRARLLAMIVRPHYFPGQTAYQQLDHRFSIRKAYQRQVPLEIVSNPRNLKLLDTTSNRRKGSRCSIGIQQLYSEAQVSPTLKRLARTVETLNADQLREWSKRFNDRNTTIQVRDSASSTLESLNNPEDPGLNPGSLS